MPGTRRVGRPGDLSGIDPTVASGLEFLGLTAYEIRVYDAILRHPKSRVPEIARISRVPQPKVYATLKRLIERGLCESHLGPINQYSALEPEDGFISLMSEAQHRQDEAREAVVKLQKQFSQASDGMSRREGRVKLFQGRPAASRAFTELVSAAEREVLIVVRFPLITGDYLEQVERICAAGGTVRMLCEMTADADTPEAKEFCTRAKKAGAKIKKGEHVPMRMGTFDGKILVLPMSDPVPDQGDGFMMLEVRNPDLVGSFTEIYELLWKSARKG